MDDCLKLTKENWSCFNCFSNSCAINKWKSKVCFRVNSCSKRHHTMLHPPSDNTSGGLSNYQTWHRVQQLVYVAYICMPNFIGVHMLLSSPEFVFSLWFFQIIWSFQNFTGCSFLVLVLYKLNTIYLPFNLFICPWKSQILYSLHLF